MTLTFMRPALALAIMLGLAGCGGTASFTIAGTVVGLNYDGLVLSTNGMDLQVPAKATSFSFPNTVSYGDVYNVVAKVQPQHQTCTVGSFIAPNGVVLNSASDTAGRLSTINIGVQCALNTYAVGGTVSGLTGDLTLTNGTLGGEVKVAAGATTFTFPAMVPFSGSYGVSVLTQPTNQTCSVSQNGTGVMGDAAVTDIAITCVAKS